MVAPEINAKNCRHNNKKERSELPRLNDHYVLNQIKNNGALGGGAPERSAVKDRYKAKPEMTAKGMLVYAVVDTTTNEWKHVYDCFLWADKKAKELNQEEHGEN